MFAAQAETVSFSPDPLDHLADKLFYEMGSPGVYGRKALYEDLVERLAALITRHREPDTEVFRFPPVMNRTQLERSGYLKSFPNLLGCVCGLHGTDSEIDAAVSRFEAGGDWTASLSPADLVLSPAACYPVYPIAASRGPVPAGGWRFDVAADCFRREPSRHLDRLQSFRMREYVCVGSADHVSEFRERWIVRAQEIARGLGLAFRVDYASDPFFGRVGQMMAVSQKQQSLKFELLVPLRSEERPTACMSFNYHRDHFGVAWGIKDSSGEPAHTACVAFGMDRLAVAMFHSHGTDVAKWPTAVRDLLGFPPDGR
ncbi:amino acid--[acyl-carrier-protein] ligase [Bradyrhizobium jicamae]|uniref:Amino acid--[acyl-carrier-protein] ligase n=1 Tax=Bradyrhizobium jicamae TaxID=280332 RepID=A0ABS5FGS6_9BRAD|nr:amino acid--[acyl-carrier-protein] ligase [Bradyrhizobium jicamae]MBR0795993.1 amino acid--[acyl-carrier-protein] ligase [Bradyrhizobium jicamae]MBR0938560.1 amino acid--[acyl-carrier-protein] ligase [Bradyrhizobium jicamae]